MLKARPAAAAKEAALAEATMEEAEDNAIDDLPPAPANSTVLRRGEAISPGELVVALDVRGVSVCLMCGARCAAAVGHTR